jgi:hypothetical protein
MQKDTQTAKIIKLLKANGKDTNRELNQICFRYGARLHELRKEGYVIKSNHIKDSLWEFIYFGKEQ